MNRGLARVGAACAVAAAVLLPAAAASAADPSGKVFNVENGAGKVSFVFQASDLPSGVSIDPASVKVRVNGHVLTSTAKPISASTRPVDRTAVLVIDDSDSMKGTRLQNAKDAATAFLSNLPADVKVGLVTFGSSAKEVLNATSDHATVQSAIDGIAVDTQTGTVTYDALVQAVSTAGDGGIRSLLLLTDGDEVGSRDATLADAVALVQSSGDTLDAVYIGGGPPPAELGQLVDGVDGRVLEADPSELAQVFENAAQSIDSQLQVTAAVPAELAKQQANIDVSGIAGGTVISVSALNVFTGAAPPPADYGPRAVQTTGAARLVSDSMLPVAIGGVFLGLLLLLAIAFTSGTPGQGKSGRVRRRLSIYTLTGRSPVKEQQTTTALGSSQVARSAVELAGRVVQRRDFESALAHRLEAAGVPLRAAEWMLIHIGVALAFAFLMLSVSGGSILPTLIGLAVGLTLPWVYLGVKESRRTSAFLAQLPDTLQLIAGSLSAGYSMPQALDAVVREGQQPITGEFNRALIEARLGVPVEDALEGVAARMKSKDFEWVVMAIRIQREVGGNLAELLNTVAGTLRERERLRRQVKVLSAEGRLSAWILGLLPPVFATYLVLVRPEYLKPLVSEALGWLLLGGGSVLLAVGALWMRKAVKVEV